jgi:hypothetical protein
MPTGLRCTSRLRACYATAPYEILFSVMATRLETCLCCCIAAHLACGSAALAQAPVRKIRQKMSDNLNSVGDFMCSVSIDRSERMGKDAPTGMPELRVSAGIINGKEVYVLPAADGDQTLLKKVLAVYRRAGTGSFAMYSRAVFFTAVATFYDGPDESKDGRTLSRLDFTVPREESHYSPINAGQPVDIGYSGSIWTDPHDQEVARLFLQADNIPPDLGIRAVTQTIEYGRTSVAGFPRVLPTAMDLTLQELSGREQRIREHFSDCRQYFSKRGEQFVENRPEAPVTVSAESLAAASPGNAPPATASLSLVRYSLPSIEELAPAKTAFEMILQDPIDERTMTEKSKVSFTVYRDVKKKDGTVILPKDATATGHITRILRQTYVLNTSVKGYYLVGMQLDTMDVEGRRYQISANLERVGPPAAQICFVPYSHNPDKWGAYDYLYQLFIIPNASDGESFLGVVEEFLRLGSQWRTYWTIAKPRS